MKIKVHEELVPYMIKYVEFRRYAEKFKKTEADQLIEFTYDRGDIDYPYISHISGSYVHVEQRPMGCYLFC